MRDISAKPLALAKVYVFKCVVVVFVVLCVDCLLFKCPGLPDGLLSCIQTLEKQRLSDK